jgi:hypothetical protein
VCWENKHTKQAKMQKEGRSREARDKRMLTTQKLLAFAFRKGLGV